jgi:hypothetical protein
MGLFQGLLVLALEMVPSLILSLFLNFMLFSFENIRTFVITLVPWNKIDFSYLVPGTNIEG